MAVRTALFRAAPGRKAKPKGRTVSAGGKAAATTKPPPKGVPQRSSKSVPKPASKGAAQRAPRRAQRRKAGSWPIPGFGFRTKRGPAAGPATKPRVRRPASRAREPRPPLLQRRTLGPVLARAALLAVAMVAMTAFAVALARVTLVPSPSSDALVHTNLRPGASIRAYLDQPNVRDSVKQIGGNILLGVPFGILLPVLFPRARGLVRTAAVTALVMVLVESAQGAIVEGRAFDIDDVILNTSGALLGYLLLGRRLGHAFHPRRNTWWQRLRHRPRP